jgi:WD40 repeat protein
MSFVGKSQIMTTFMSPPPAATYLAFHPQDNNIVAVGMNDSTIHIYNVRVDEVMYIMILIKIEYQGSWSCSFLL